MAEHHQGQGRHKGPAVADQDQSEHDQHRNQKQDVRSLAPLHRRGEAPGEDRRSEHQHQRSLAGPSAIAPESLEERDER